MYHSECLSELFSGSLWDVRKAKSLANIDGGVLAPKLGNIERRQHTEFNNTGCADKRSAHRIHVKITESSSFC